MATSVPPHHRRRTQAQRAAATREALLDATVACLIEDGYATTTTSRVAERAGVSRGAHLHPFQTRSALVAAAIRHLSWRRGRELHAAVEGLPEGEGRVAAALDLLWATYSSPLFAAALELWSHARTDAELREHLVAVDRALDAETLGLAHRLVAVEQLLDLLGEDVLAARDDHVVIAAVDEQAPRLVEVADVARGHQAVGQQLLVLAARVAGERHDVADEDAPRRSGRHVVAVVVDDAHPRAPRRRSDALGRGEEVLGRGDRRVGDLGRAI